jgi:hypothetical protein
MKLIKILLCGAVMGAVAFFPASKAKAAPLKNKPRPSLNISGTVMVQDPSFPYGSIKKLSLNNKTLISLLNASPTVQNYITNNVTHSVTSNSIPAGSYFVWDMNSEDVWVTNKNGFSFNVESSVTFYVDYDVDVKVGSFSLKNTTGAGSEMDVTGVKFYFDDKNGNILEPEYGEGVFNWTYGAVSGGVQQKTISVKLSPGSYSAEVNGFNAITTTFNVSGSGSSAGLAPFGALGEPFYLY